MQEMALLKVIRCFGSQAKLARYLGVYASRINYWLNEAKKIPFEYAVKMEEAIDGAVSCYDLAPHGRLRCREFFKNKATKKMCDGKISERVAIGVMLEKENNNYRPGSDERKTLDRIAEQVGFNSKDTYLRAKNVVRFGIFKLVEAMDSGAYTINKAFGVAQLSPEEQEAFLLTDRCAGSLVLIGPELEKISLSHIIEAILKNQREAIDVLFKNDQLAQAEDSSQLPLKFALLYCLGRSNAQGYFSWDFTSVICNGLTPLIVERACAIFMTLGVLKKVKVGEESYGQFILSKDIKKISQDKG